MFLSIKSFADVFFSVLFSTSFLRLTAKKNLHVVDKYGPQNAAENDENYEGKIMEYFA